MNENEANVAGIERCIEALAAAYQSHPFDMLKERDSVCYLYHVLSEQFPGRVPLELDPGITSPVDHEQETHRVHSEVSVIDSDKGRIDLAVLLDRRYVLESKPGGMPRRFRPPFLTGIELKMSHSASGRTLQSQVAPRRTCEVWPNFVSTWKSGM